MTTTPSAVDPLGAQMRATFDALNAASVPYVVLRGFRPVSELASSIDVDVYVPRHALAHASSVLAGVGWMRRRHQVGRFPHVFFDSWEGAPGFLRSMDVVTDLCYGRDLHTLADAARVLDDAELLDGVRVPAPWVTAFTFALHVALDKGELSESNARRAREMLAACRTAPEGRARLAGRFGEDAARLVDRLGGRDLVPGAPVADLAAAARALPVLRSRPLLARRDALRARWVQFRRPVVRVAMLGIDGSGKSTLVADFTTAPSTMRVGTGYLGSNHFRTPPARWMEAWLATQRARGDETSVAYRVVANLNALWLPFELAARMAIAEHWSELVLYDRFPLGQDDGAPTTTWGRLVHLYATTMRRLLPRPDVVVLLDGDDRTIWERKREFPFEVHQRTQEAYRALVRGLGVETATVRTDGTLDQSRDALRRALAASPVVRRKLYGD